jgi:hypothetical protein
MQTVEYWRWWIVSETTGRRVKTRHLMTEAQALERDPTATRVPGTMEPRQVPEPGEYVPPHFNPGKLPPAG